MRKKVSLELVVYIEKEFFPTYETFDKGHDLEHINEVIDQDLKIVECLDDWEKYDFHSSYPSIFTTI